MWKWILLIIVPFLTLVIVEEVISYIVRRLTGPKQDKMKKLKTNIMKETQSKKQQRRGL
ncbi:hypothetical protein MUB24_05630 [Lederbergia sp. NSJ-179]|uniref:hypothetical protein n=1 Tax=Lederbergia sp. NSJ-179 TaxID=2931402 RepID=UPI001FD43376|nr:hypothetical protein [Lederbergia sp. NSJ-179]MCJ7840406.1 hypothetical protein [Lederbergia sp. NSJ-179]